MRERKAAEAAKKKAKEEAAKKAAEEAQRQKEVEAQELEERRRTLAEAATAHSQRGSSPGETLVSPRRPVVEIRREKGKGKAKVWPVGGILMMAATATMTTTMKTNGLPANNAGARRSLARCRLARGVRSYVRCSYSNRPFMVKQEGGAHPTGERLAVLESQMAQLLADNRHL
ncbi:hypothetical protein EV359DRAFT_68724 [Lentinula novae-zelandiae]|nr:hypothetical protein EV359DRAFT_68724 [Lentinula novae-zelandiae]